MTGAEPRLTRIARDRGHAGASVAVTVYGSDLAAVTSVRLSGRGALALLRHAPQPDRMDVEIVIAADAPPGPRALALGFTAGDGALQFGPWQDVLFHVLAPTSYGGISGIGSHLI